MDEFKWLDETEGFQEGLASTFGYNDPEDSGVGAWGDSTNDPEAFGVSLPIQTLREVFGDDDDARGAVVEVSNPVTGATIRAPIVDKGPAKWVVARQGPTIDLTEGARRALGHSGGIDPMVWRILGHGVEPDRPALVPGGAQDGFQWLDNTNTPEIASEGTTVRLGEQPDEFKWVDETPVGEDYVEVPGLPGKAEAQAEQGLKWVDDDQVPGMMESGTIDLAKRPVVQNPDGSFSTEKSVTITEDGKAVLIPSIVKGKEHSIEDAINHYRKTGEHMGKFADITAADAYAERVHKEQEQRYVGMQPKPGPPTEETAPSAPSAETPTGQNDLLDAVNSFGRGTSSEGVLSILEGGYAAIEANLPDFLPGSKTIRKNARKERDKVSAMRERVRKEHLPVDRDFEEHLVGQVLQGAGQLVSNLPAYAVPGMGPTVAAMQLYDEARQDYKQTIKDQGRPVDEEQANRAALKYLMLAGPLEYVADKLMIRKFLKGETGRTTKQIVKDAGTAGLVEGLTEVGQQLWLNTIAKIGGTPFTEGYDPERKLNKELLSSFLVGGILGTGITVAGEALPKKKPEDKKKEGFGIPAAEDAKLARLKETIEKAEGAPSRRAEVPTGDEKFAPGAPKEPVAKEQEEGDITTDQPTSDEELESLKRAYETIQQPREPAPVRKGTARGVEEQLIGSVTSAQTQPSKFSQERDAVRQLSFEDFQREFTPLDRIFRRAAADLGIPLEYTAGHGAAIDYSDADGNIKLIVNPSHQIAKNRVSRLPSGTEAEITVGEEMIHGAHTLGIKQEWEDAGKPGPFYDYFNAKVKGVWQDVSNTIKQAPENEREQLEQDVADAWNLYKTDFGSTPIPSKWILDYVDEAFRGDLTFVSEFLRMVQQHERQGLVSEQTAKTMWDKIKSWVGNALARIYKALPGAREGKYGKQVQRELKRIDDIMQGKQVQPSRVVPGAYATREAPTKVRQSLVRAMQRLGLKPGPATVNIGLATDDGKGITVDRVLKSLSDAGVKVTNYRVQQSGTEPTVVAYLDKTLDPDEAFKISEDLNQQAIAEAWAEGAEIYGPGAEVWRPFDRAYFLAGRKSPDPELARGLDELEKIALDYEKFKRWYHDFNAFLDRVLLPENRTYKGLITDFLAATSPAETIQQNALQTLRKLREFVETGTVTTKGGLGIVGKHKLPNLMRAIKGEKLLGPKVGPYSQAMRLVETTEAAPIDRHVARVLFNLGPEDKVTDAQIRVGQRVSGEIAERLGWTPTEVQAAWWAAGKELLGLSTIGKNVDTYEQYLEEHRNELNDILTKDREGKGESLRALESVLERAGETAGTPGTRGPPRRELERLGTREEGVSERGPESMEGPRGSPWYSAERASKGLTYPTKAEALRRQKKQAPGEREENVLGARGAPAVPVTQRPVLKPVIDPKLWKTHVSLAGEKSRSWNTPSVSPARFWDGTRDVFLATPGLEYLGRAIAKHTDLRKKYSGHYSARMDKAIQAIPKSSQKQVGEEFAEYWQENQEHGRIAADALTISPHTRTLIDNIKGMLDEIGDHNQKSNVHVFDPALGKFRKIGKIGSSGTKDYFPRMIKPHVLDVLHNAASDPAAWDALREAMIGEGLIDRDNAEAEMLKYVDNMMATYKANGFFGSLDVARSPYMPNLAYDYSFDVIRRYVDSWSERMAQIESFGQKLGKQGKDLFDKAWSEAGSGYTKQYIGRVRDLAYNAYIDTWHGRSSAVMNNLATASQLANFASTMKNFMSGMAFNWQNLGTGRFLWSFMNLKETWREIQDGSERGILASDLMNVMHDGQMVGPGGELRLSKTGKLAGIALKATGFTAAETWVRGVSMVGARAMLRSATEAYNRNRNSSRSRKWLGYFQRLGIDGEALINEGGQGDLFDAYMRRSVNEIQGGYTYADVPMMMDTPIGRFLFKYQKWGVEQLRHFVDGALKPFLRGTHVAFQETVSVTQKDGTVLQKRVPGQFMPLARYVLVLAAAGAGIEWLLEKIFGRDSQTASLAEVMSTWKEDKKLAFAKEMETIFGYYLTVGAGGILGNYLQSGWDFTQRRRFKNPMDPPGLAPFKETINATIDLFDQGEINAKNVDDYLTKVIGGLRSGKQVAARMQDMFGVTGFRPLEVLARRQDYSWIRSVTRRYDKSIGVTSKVRFTGTAGRSEESNFRDMLFEDLMLGDRQAAARRIDEHLKGMSDERKKAALTSIKQSVGGRQPIKAGAGGGDREAGRQNFKAWAKRHLGPEENARIDRIDLRYRNTAQALDLMRADEIVPEVNLKKAMDRIKLMAE